MNISEDLENINSFIKYLSMVSKSITDKLEDNNNAKITIQEYNTVKNLSKIITEYFNNDNNDNSDIDSDIDLEFLEDKSDKSDISDSFILKIKNNELSKEHLLSHNSDLDKKCIIFNLNCLNN
jgi:hypothetical protein